MKTVYIDTKQISSVQLLQDFLRQELNCPSYYGRNLDALYDVLTTIHEDTEIYISKYENSQDKSFNRYMERFLRVLHDAEMQNAYLTVIIDKTGI